MIIEQLIKGVVLPGIASLVIAAIFMAGAKKPKQAQGRVAGLALAVAIAFCAGYLATLGWPREFPPVDVSKWLPYLAILGLVLGSLATSPKAWLLTAVLRLGASFAVPYYMLEPTREYTWSPVAGWAWTGVIALVIFLIWTMADSAAQKLGGPGIPFAFALAAGGAAVALLWGRSAMLSQVGGMLAAATGALFLVSLWRPNLTLARGAMPVFMLVYLGLLLNGYFFAELPLVPALLLAIAPACAAFAGSSAKKKGFAKFIITVILVLIPVGIALGLSYLAQAQKTVDQPVEEYVY